MEAVGRLAGGVAHDFNNLLTVIQGFSELLRRSMDDKDERLEDLEQIERAASRAAGLTRQLLAFSRRQILEPRALSVNDVVDALAKMLRRIIGEDVALTVTTVPGLWAVVA